MEKEAWLLYLFRHDRDLYITVGSIAKRRRAMSKPLCSIITPCHNSERYLRNAIDSIQNQTFSDWELLLIDDYSTDKTPEICKSAKANDDRIKQIRLSNRQGPAIARNTGIEAARGRYIFFLDSDDTWDAQKLQKQIPCFERDNVSIVHSNYRIETYDNQKDPGHYIVAPESLYHQDLLRGNHIGCLTAGYDTNKVGKIYMPNIPMRQDWGLWLRILKQGGIAYCVQEPLATLLKRQGSLTANKAKATYYSWQLLRKEAQLGHVEATINTFYHIMNSIRRKKHE